MRKSRVVWLVILGNTFGACVNAKPQPNAADPRLAALQRQSALISRTDDQCIAQASSRTDAQVKRLIAGGSDPGSAAVRLVLDQGDGAIAKCREHEAAAQAAIATQESAEYVREAQAERDRAALMATLTGSLGR